MFGKLKSWIKNALTEPEYIPPTPIPEHLTACDLCNQETDLPYTCNFCGLVFCDEHRLPENHQCLGIPEKKWDSYRNLKKVK